MKKSNALERTQLDEFVDANKFAAHIETLLSGVVSDLGVVKFLKFDKDSRPSSSPTSLNGAIFTFTPSDDQLRKNFEEVYEGYGGAFWFEVTSFTSSASADWFSLHLRAITTCPSQSLKSRAFHPKGDIISFAAFKVAIRSAISTVRSEMKWKERLSEASLQLSSVYENSRGGEGDLGFNKLSSAKTSLRYAGKGDAELNVVANLKDDDSYSIELKGLTGDQLRSVLTKLAVLDNA